MLAPTAGLQKPASSRGAVVLQVPVPWRHCLKCTSAQAAHSKAHWQPERHTRLTSSRASTTCSPAVSTASPVRTTEQHAPAAETQPSLNHCPDDPELQRRCIEAALHIKEHGWAVVEGVIPQDGCDAYLASMWSWLEGLGTGIDRNNPATWTAKRWPPTFRGILNTLEVGHQDFVWRIRCNPRLTRVWESMLGTNELLVSFDAINMLGPHNEQPSAGWLHMDQTPLRIHLACLQGIVNLVPVNPNETATLMVKDGSHKAHQDFFLNASGLSRQELERIPDHYQYTQQQLPYWDRYPSVRLGGGAGCVFIWDSRTTHSNASPAQIKAWRQVAYVCYQPRSMASERDLQLKRKAWDNYQMTTHLPAENIRIYDEDFAKLYPNEAKVSMEETPYDIARTRDRAEDATIRRLAGLERYPPHEVRRSTPLLELSDDELRSMLQKE